MGANPFLGVIYHAIGGFAAGTFYLPYKKVRGWSWESYWLAGGFFSWILAPIFFALIFNWGHLAQVYGGEQVTPQVLFWTYFFGAMWGIGGLTYGLTMRYLGLSLGIAVTLGFCAAFGTMIPPIVNTMQNAGGVLASMTSFLPKMSDTDLTVMLSKPSGMVVFAGVLVCLGGIGVCGRAGVRRESEQSEEQRAAMKEDFHFVKGVWIAIFSGIMSASMAYAFAAGKPISEAATALGTNKTFSNTPVLIIILLGGFTTNFLWCMFLNFKNRSFKDYVSAPAGVSNSLNYLFSALAGVTWYLQFFFYGMGTTKMGSYDFSSWTLHMAFIIVFGNLWGIALKEWHGTKKKTHLVIATGITVLVLSTIIVGYGNFLGLPAK